MSGKVISMGEPQPDAVEAYRQGWAAGLTGRGPGLAGSAAPDAETGASDSPAAPGTGSGVPCRNGRHTTLRLAPPGGELTAARLHAAAAVARRWGDGEAEVTPDGGLALGGIATHALDAARSALAAAGLEVADARIARGGVRRGHVGIVPQRTRGRHDVGVALPAGLLTAHQMDGLAIVAALHGTGRVFLTQRQNAVVPDVAGLALGAVERRVRAMGLDLRPGVAAAGLTVRTDGLGEGAARALRAEARALCRHLDRCVVIDRAVAIVIGTVPGIGTADIALRGATGADGVVVRYDVLLAGPGGTARAILAALPAADLPGALGRLLHGWLRCRGPGEPFQAFARRLPDTTLGAMLVGAA